MSEVTLKYLKIKKQILAHIESGLWKPGNKIPAMPELIKMFGASRITIGHALRLLANEGIISRRRGAGTFVETMANTGGSKSTNLTVNIVMDDVPKSAGIGGAWSLNSEIHRGIINHCQGPVKMIKKSELYAADKTANGFIFFNWPEELVTQVLEPRSVYCRINSVPTLFSPLYSINYDAQISLFNAVAYVMAQRREKIYLVVSEKNEGILLPGYLEAHELKKQSFSKNQIICYSQVESFRAGDIRKKISNKKNTAIITDSAEVALKIKKSFSAKSTGISTQPLLISFDDDQMLNEQNGITGIEVPYYEIGRKALRIITHTFSNSREFKTASFIYGRIVSR